MKKKINLGTGGIVYSTDPEFRGVGLFAGGGTPEPAGQLLQVRLDKKQRAGKTVTLVEGFTGKLSDLEALGKSLKSSCGTGGTVKDGLILLQGNYLERVRKLLSGLGYPLEG